jgi:hypothetical protein
MAATDVGARNLERYEERVDRALASRIEGADKQREDDALTDQRFRESVRLPPHPSERAQVSEASAPAGEERVEHDLFRPDSEDEAMGETLAAGEIKRRVRVQSLRGPHPCDGRTPSRSELADDEDAYDEVTAVLAVIGPTPAVTAQRRRKWSGDLCRRSIRLRELPPCLNG